MGLAESEICLKLSGETNLTSKIVNHYRASVAVKRFDTILTSNQQILGKYKVHLKIANGTVVSVALVLRAVIVYIELSQVSMMGSFPFSEALMCSSVGRRRDSCKMAAGLGLAG